MSEREEKREGRIELLFVTLPLTYLTLTYTLSLSLTLSLLLCCYCAVISGSEFEIFSLVSFHTHFVSQIVDE